MKIRLREGTIFAFVMAVCFIGCAMLALARIAQATYVTFDSVEGHSTGDDPRSISCADFNRDGHSDIAVGNALSSTISVFLNNGDGSFSDKVDYPSGGDTYSLAAADFNGDSKTDLVAANFGQGTVSVLLGNGDGTFAPNVSYPAGGGARSVVAADFDNDAKIDVAVANYIDNDVSVFLGKGDGSLNAKTDYKTGAAPRALLAADYNNDNRCDLIALSNVSNSFSLLRGRGDGTFEDKVDIGTGDSPRSIAVGDFNKDGKADFVTANAWSDNISVFLGNGNGTFIPKTDYPLQLSNSIVVGDFNEDTYDDFALTGGDYSDFNKIFITFFLNKKNGTFERANDVSIALDGGAFCMTKGDFNGDGHLDLATGNFNDSLTVYTRLWDSCAPTLTFPKTVKSQGSYVGGVFNIPVVSIDKGVGLESINCREGSTVLHAIYTSSLTCSYSFRIDTRLLTGGKHTLTFCASDKNDNSFSVNRFYFVDNAKPKTSAPRSAIVKRNSFSKLYYKIVDAYSPSAKVTIKIKNRKGSIVKKLSLGVKDTNRLLCFRYRVTLPKGTYRFFVYAQDKAGNNQSNSASNKLIIR